MSGLKLLPLFTALTLLRRSGRFWPLKRNPKRSLFIKTLSGRPLSYRNASAMFQPLRRTRPAPDDILLAKGISHVKPTRKTLGVSSWLSPHSHLWGHAGFWTVALMLFPPCALSAPSL